MLQKMRDQTQSFGFRVLVGVMIVVLAVFGFGAFNLFTDNDPEAAVVNGDEISQRQLEAELQREMQRLSAQFGENFDPSMLDSNLLRKNVLDRLVSRALLAEAAKDQRLGVSQATVDRRILENPNFHDLDGKYDSDRHVQVARAMGFSPGGFMEEVREMSAVGHLRGGYLDTAFLLDWEQRALAKLAEQTRDIAFLTFDAQQFAEGVEVTDDEVSNYYEDNQLQYMTEEKIDVDYVVLELSTFLDDPEIKVDETDLRAVYEQEKSSYKPEERRRGSHILLNVTDERDETAAVAEVQAIVARLNEGEAFADLAKDFSDDPGSAANGGDLGLAGKGVFVPPFEQALWALEPGELSEPVVTEFGVHLIRLEEIEAPQYPSFEEQRTDLEQTMRRQQAGPIFEDRVRELGNIAFEEPESLQPLVDRFGLGVERTEGITRDAGTGEFANTELRDAAFDDDALVEGNNSTAVMIGNEKAVVARVVNHFQSAPIPLEDASEGIRDALVQAESEARADEALAEAFARLQQNAPTGDVANSYGLQWRTFERTRRNQPGIANGILVQAFELPRPDAGGKSLAIDPASRSIVTVTRVQDGDVSTMTETQLSSLRQYLDQRAGNLDFTSLYRTLEERASVDYR